MGYLLVCIAAAAAMGISVFTASASLLFAFLAYSLTGTIILFAILLSEGVAGPRENQFSTTE